MNLNINQIILGGFLIRFGFAFYGSFLGDLIGANADSAAFHYRAANIWYNIGLDKYESIFRHNSFLLEGSILYINFLKIIYNITIPHIFIGALTSCIAWFFSAKFLLKSISLMNIIGLNQKKIFLIYCFLPSSIIYCSIPMREPFQLLFVNIMLYLFLKINMINIGLFKNIFLYLLCAYILSALHYSFLFSSLLSICYMLIANLYIKIKSRFTFLFFFLITMTFSFTLFNNIINTIYEYELYEAIQNFNEGSYSLEARATYRKYVNLDSSFDLLTFFPSAFFQYMLEPLPNNISSIFDIMLFFENLVRVSLLLKAFYFFKRYPVTSSFLFIIVFFISIELIWSVGTTNWGTAVRHHIPSLGLLCSVAYIFPNNNLIKK